MLSDTLGNLGAILAGALIWVFQWHWVDPLTSVIIRVYTLEDLK